MIDTNRLLPRHTHGQALPRLCAAAFKSFTPPPPPPPPQKSQ